jgi:hypothetical protein
MPLQGPPLQNNQGTVEIIVLHIILLYYYIYSFSAETRSLPSCTASHHFHYTDISLTNLLIYSNNTK